MEEYLVCRFSKLSKFCSYSTQNNHNKYKVTASAISENWRCAYRCEQIAYKLLGATNINYVWSYFDCSYHELPAGEA